METQTMPPPAPAGLTERWISAPTGLNVCPFTSLKHGKFYLEFADNENVRQVRTGTGKQRGKRLFWLPDIYAELERKGREQMEAAER